MASIRYRDRSVYNIDFTDERGAEKGRKSHVLFCSIPHESIKIFLKPGAAIKYKESVYTGLI